jgi:dihydroneopterin triphosphate diphosphatase
MSLPKQPISVLVVIHTPDHQFLLIERAKHPGYWQSVTGSREGDDTLIDTAQRELFEETGLMAKPGELLDWHMSQRYEIFTLWRHRYAEGVTHNTEHVFSFCVPKPCPVTLAPAEHRAYQWLPSEAAAAACFSQSNRDVIVMIAQGVRPTSP